VEKWPDLRQLGRADLLCQLVWSDEPILSNEDDSRFLWVDAARAAASLHVLPDSSIRNQQREVRISVLVIHRHMMEWHDFRAMPGAGWPPRLDRMASRRHRRQRGESASDLTALAADWIGEGPCILVGAPSVSQNSLGEIRKTLAANVLNCFSPDQLSLAFAQAWSRHGSVSPEESPPVEIDIPRFAWGAIVPETTLMKARRPVQSYSFRPTVVHRRTHQFNLRLMMGGDQNGTGCELEQRLPGIVRRRVVEERLDLDLCTTTGASRLRSLQSGSKSPQFQGLAWPRVVERRQDTLPLVVCFVVPADSPDGWYRERAALTVATLLGEERVAPASVGVHWQQANAAPVTRAWSIDDLRTAFPEARQAAPVRTPAVRPSDGVLMQRLQKMFDLSAYDQQATPPTSGLPDFVLERLTPHLFHEERMPESRELETDGLMETLDSLLDSSREAATASGGLLLWLITHENASLDQQWLSRREARWAWNLAARRRLTVPLSLVASLGRTRSETQSVWHEPLAHLVSLGCQARRRRRLISSWSATGDTSSECQREVARLLAVAEHAAERLICRVPGSPHMSIPETQPGVAVEMIQA